jgi:hypothetical protein
MSLPAIKGFWYLASPYSSHPEGPWIAYRQAAHFAGNLAKLGHKVFSPIAHAHPLAIEAKLDPFDHEFWLPFDEPFMRAADGLIVATLPGWEDSKGIKHEIESFQKQRKQIVYMGLE